MGGDGWTRFYPLETFLRDARVNQVGAGTSEVMRMVLYRWGIRASADELQMPHRRIHQKLGIPISTTKVRTISEISEKSVLGMLAEDYRVNPGLYMSRSDMKEILTSATDEQLDKVLVSLETKGFEHQDVIKKELTKYGYRFKEI